MPYAHEFENPRLVGADILGGTLDPGEQLIFRQAPEMFPASAPVPELYVAGGSVNAGAGVHGAIGHGPAAAMLADARREG